MASTKGYKKVPEPSQQTGNIVSDSESEPETEQEKQKEDSNPDKTETKKQGKQTKDSNSNKAENEKNNKSKGAKPEAPPKKRGRGKEDTKEPEPKKQKADPPAKPDTDISKLDFTKCDNQTADGKTWNFKISSWNVAGLRAWVRKNGVDYIKKELPDIITLQETKCPERKLPPEVKIPGYHTYWISGDKDGYAGVALYSKEKPLNISYGIGNKEFDTDGRLITAEYEKFYLVAAYVPNAGQGLKTLPKRMKWDKEFREYLKKLDSKKPVILAGDLNVAHNEIDLANPKTNTRSAGFTQEERDAMTELLKQGFVDSFRHLYPDKTGAYTYWTYIGNARSRNTGWRLDYFVLSERLVPHLCDNVIRNQMYGSDHCPITLFLNI